MRTRVGYVILLGLSLAVALRAYRSPFPTFDRLLYAAAVAHLHTSDPNQIAEQAFQLAGRSDYPHTAFTDQLLAQPNLIAEQVPFYAIRPLYIYALASLGLRTVSPLAYLGIVFVLALWARSAWWVMPLTLLPDLIGIAREITPDALSAFVVLGGFLLVKRGYRPAGLAALLLSLGVRTDNLVFLVPLLVVLALNRTLDWRAAIGFGAAAVAAVAGINYFAHNYGWTILMRHSFAGGLIHPSTAVAPVSAQDYIGYLVHGATGVLSVCSLWVLLGALVWRYSEGSREFLLIAASFCFLHILAFPIADPRYFVAAFLLVSALMIETFAKGNSSTDYEQSTSRLTADGKESVLPSNADAPSTTSYQEHLTDLT
jgi:hypothetical protein